MPESGSIVTLDQSVLSFASRAHGHFVDGAALPSTGDARIEVFDPATGEAIATIADATAVDVDRAVASAKTAFDNGVWRTLSPAERERILLRFASLVEANGEQLAQLETLNQGKSINIARMVDVGASLGFMRYYAGLATKHNGQSLDVSIGMPPGARYTAFTRHEPVGVVAAIAPWNFPMMIGLWKVMPALAAGCSVVLKPSEVTPLTSLRLAEIAVEAGIPAGAFNVVTGGGAAGAALTAHPDIAKVSFTGSTATGKAIARSVADRMLRATFELGGKNPAIFLKDAPIAQAVGGAMMGSFFNNGQVCAASSRLYVAREIFGDFLGALEGAVNGMAIGPGLDTAAQINPVVSALHRDKIVAHIEGARAAGARVLAGGQVPNRPGFYVSPTIIVDAGPDMAICREEVFGPVITVTPFDDEAEAVRLANDTRMGLTASVWTNDLTKALGLVSQIRAGTVWVNSHNMIDPNMPFGGFQESGIGRDFGTSALDSYTELKSICIAH